MGAGRASRVAVAVVVGTVLLITMVVTWAATTGPEAVLTGEGPSPRPASARPSEAPHPPAFTTATPGITPRHQLPRDLAEALGRLIRALATIFAVTVMAAAVAVTVTVTVLLVRGLWRRWEVRRRPPPPPPVVEFDVVETPRRVAGSIARDAEQQRLLLSDADEPRNGIVACWHRFEEQAAGTGVVREEWETSAEFTLRVLELVDADWDAVTRLAELYREARFSDHPLDESHRTAALAALDAIHARLPAQEAGLPR